jgi:hypothetical protein
MKPTILIITASIYLCVLSCTKQASRPIINSTDDTTHTLEKKVTISDWFSANWQHNQVMEFTKSVPELSNDLLKGGKVLVFGKGGFEMRSATALPSTFDANYIGVIAQAGDLKFVLEGSGAISSTLKFKYILIPAEKLAPGKSLDYLDYHAVCAYYKLPE